MINMGKTVITTDFGDVKVGGIILPGTFQKLEVESDAKVDEVDVKGKSVKPKQATGYEDAKVKFTLIIRPNNKEDEYTQLAKIQRVFRKPEQGKPQVFDIVNKHVNTRGVRKIIFKKLTTQEDNKSNILLVTCEFWEYIPITLKAGKAGKNNNKKKSKKANKNSKSNASSLKGDYKSYLNNNRGKANKTAAVDDDAKNVARKWQNVKY